MIIKCVTYKKQFLWTINSSAKLILRKMFFSEVESTMSIELFTHVFSSWWLYISYNFVGIFVFSFNGSFLIFFLVESRQWLIAWRAHRLCLIHVSNVNKWKCGTIELQFAHFNINRDKNWIEIPVYWTFFLCNITGFTWTLYNFIQSPFPLFNEMANFIPFPK